MKSVFLKLEKDKIIKQKFSAISNEHLKRKFIDFNVSRYSNLIQFGIILSIEKPNREWIEWGYNYECYHAHIFIDLFFWCIEITFMDYE